MGIDIYTRWKGQTKEEEELQYKVWSDPTKGELGYLREAYHGDPYATDFLLQEAFEKDVKGEAKIPAKVLRERLPRALELIKEREEKLYGGKTERIKSIQKSYEDFVALIERKEKETGELVTILASY